MLRALKRHSGERVVLKTVGMCGLHCAAKVESALRSLDGVTSAAADFEKNEVAVEYDPRRVALEDLEKSILNVGYRVR